ncbi:sugar ABC transporter substrate-binding protein [Capsulimonas corticalis]|uniref:Sugar ABC transporter substrate-binding protein n=1 Tax=Capsulimonas corticalis TaxID=2219043 RepID=A0A402D6A4_9BACT|nr:ABC transporter substrate-binding protein [Capsulimonas corticalis]BDI32069.1 sugar ABC transporter substrate-binding protein [Capsulimonas corticalis]
MKFPVSKAGALGAAMILALGSVITGCGPKTETLLSATAAPQADQREPVYYWHMWSAEWQPVMEHVVDEFNASQTKYRVIPLQIPYGSADSKFLLSVAGGNPPDVMAQWTQAISTWSQGGILQPLETRMTPAERQYFDHDTYPVIHNNGWYKGHLYGMVMGVDVYACYYRVDDFQKAGLDPDKFPTTLEELTTVGHKLDQFEGGNLTRVGFLPSGLTQYAPSFGGGFYDAATHQVLLNTPQNLKALTYLVDTKNQLGMDRVMRYSSSLKSQNGASWPFIDGSVSISLDGEWRVQQLAKFAPNLKYKVALLPPPAGGKAVASYSNTNFLTIPAGAKHAQGAWEFIKFWAGLNDHNRAAEFNTRFGWLPSSNQMLAAPAYQAYLKKYPQYKAFVTLAASPNLVTIPPTAYQMYLADHISSADDLAERGSLSPAAALTGLEHDVARERARRKELGYDE